MPTHFMIPCDFGGRKAPFPIYVGEPKPDNHPLHNQSWWLSSERGGTIPQEVMDSFEKLHNIAKENNVSFEELCIYAMGEAMEQKQVEESGGAPATAMSSPPDTPGMEEFQEEKRAREEAEAAAANGEETGNTNDPQPNQS